FAEGWPEYEWRLRIPESQTPQMTWPRWDGSSLDGKSILLVAEQGLGDTIQFIRYAAELKRRFSCRVVAVVQKPLLGLLADCDGVDELLPRETSPPVCDFWSPLMSLPSLFGQNSLDALTAKIPYLTAQAERQSRWQRELTRATGLKIGIAWQVEKISPTTAVRSVPLTAFAPLGQLAEVTLISLQKHDGLEQLAQLAGRFEVVTLGEEFDAAPFLDSAAVMKCLDLVITADTSIAHLAGALGVPVWVALPFVPDWRWQTTGDTTPWYPTLRLFRQPKPGDWNTVFERMASELTSKQEKIPMKTPAEQVLATCGFNRLTRAKHGLMLFNRHDMYIGRSIELYGEFSEGEVDLFRQVLRPGNVVIEAGANIGAHTLPLAKLVGEPGQVYAFEPQRVVFQTLCANLALNGLTNVFARCEAVGDAPGVITVPKLDYARTNNFGGLSLSQNGDGERVPVVTIDSLDLPRCNLLKADVEGMELNVLRGAAQTIAKFRPILYVENDRAEKSPALIEYLQSLGYVLYWHLPYLFNSQNDFQNPHNAFGGTVSVNMLGFHSSISTNITGLRRVEGPDSNWRTSPSG
ncbi:MAG TPA: FkbM family methyltransferase, partial [Planctomycetaceae bacterium]|nr:FkbM family methyltransferase [Planctomycetaceae bacterium]